MYFSLCKRIADNISRVIVGKDRAIELMLVGLLAEGHVLLEDVPGVAKTLLAKSLAKSIGGTFNREIYGQIQSNQRILTRIQTAQRRMRNPRHWPSRMREWFAAPSMGVRALEAEVQK